MAQICTFQLDGLLFGVEVERVQEVIRSVEVTPVPLAPRTLSGLMNLRGQIVTVIDLRRRLDLPDRPSESSPMNMVVRTGEGPVSLVVDRIGEVIDVSPTTMEERPATLTGQARELIRGAYQLPDRLLLALDLDKTLGNAS